MPRIGRTRDRGPRAAVVKIVNDRDQGTIACESCVLADSALVRMKGLLGRKQLSPGEGLLLRPASAIHTFFMRFSIDVVFLDRNLQVLAVAPSVKPWRAVARRGARAVLELPQDECQRRRIRPGDRLRVE